MVSDSTPPTKVMAQKCLDVGALPNDTILVSMKLVLIMVLLLLQWSSHSSTVSAGTGKAFDLLLGGLPDLAMRLCIISVYFISS